MEKPIQLSIEETKDNIVDFINKECIKNNIDYYFLSTILKELYEETLINKDKELESMKKELSKGEDVDELHKNNMG